MQILVLLWVFRLLHVREYKFWISGNFGSSYPDIQQIVDAESLILGFGIRNTAQGIHNSTIDRNAESKFYCSRRGIQIQDYLGFPYLGRFRTNTCVASERQHVNSSQYRRVTEGCTQRNEKLKRREKMDEKHPMTRSSLYRRLFYLHFPVLQVRCRMTSSMTLRLLGPTRIQITKGGLPFQPWI